ncbi:MAG TPA: 6-pyruvoyl tetrahydropterin synthase family protein [Lacipirellulaceae bacterium]|nr:6-pyruvoyl tetrahydropterin synthase family protein [Lacipirellulaceae bacterium]HMP05968.1 6-pyruvoyl tetrahydropterin synthase family protein [Lacipirellulaceae bacterium]
MSEAYSIRLAKERLTFSAAHFITYDGDVCEPLHGHNYHVEAVLEGPLDENSYVVDFLAVRDALQAIVDQFDHRVLLPTGHRTIRVTRQGDEVVAAHGDRRWIFPQGDCVLLDVANTTAELLARHIADQLRERLPHAAAGLTRLEVAVDECDGQWGRYAWRAGR